MRYLFLMLLLPVVAFSQPTIKQSTSHIIKDYDVKTEVKARYMTIQVGDSTSKDYEPSFTVDLWEGECKFKMYLANAEDSLKELTPELSLSLDKQTIDIEGTVITHKMIEREDGMVWDMIFDSKPKTNVFYQKIETEGLVFTYQPELTQGEIDDGSYRPDSVVGSYAVYHTSKRHNYTVMEDWKPVQYAYLAGKAFHVYPGYTWDANYDSVKNIILIDTVSNIFSVEVDQKFLDNAVYPVTVDPQIGNTDVGGSDKACCSYRSRGIDITMTEGGTVDSIVVYLNPGSSDELGGTVYNSDNSTLLDSSTTITSSFQWSQLISAETPTLSASTTYRISAICAPAAASDAATKFDAGTGWYCVDDWPPAASCSASGSSEYISVYIVYTATGGEETGQVIIIN